MQIGDRTTIAGIVLSAAIALGTVAMPPNFWAAHEGMRAAVLAACGAVAIACILYLCYLHINSRSRVLYPILLMLIGGASFFAGAIWLGIGTEKKISDATTNNTESILAGPINFESVTAWTLSVHTGPIVGIFSGDESFVALQGCRFANLSTTQRRVVDLKLVIPTHDASIPKVILDTANALRQVYRHELTAAGVDINTLGRGINLLKTPIEIEPSAVVEGMVEFDLPHEVIEKSQEKPFFQWTDPAAGEVVITELRSSLTITKSLSKDFNATDLKYPPN